MLKNDLHDLHARRIIKTTAQAWGLRLQVPNLLYPACSRRTTKQETPRRATGSNCAFQGQPVTGADFGSCESDTEKAQGLTIFNTRLARRSEKPAPHWSAVFLLVGHENEAFMTQDEALALWEYRGGNLYWRENRGTKMKAGDKAGWVYCSRPGLQYWKVEVCGKGYHAHRIIFLMHRGYLPDEIDHIDGNGLNNDIENLRAATRSQNGRNRGAPKHNTSGFKGVSWHKKSNKWRAVIKFGGKQRHLGYLDTPEAAHEAYKAAATKLHKEFANFG